MSNLTVPVGSSKNKKSWEQLQQETETGEEVKEAGVQVQVILTSHWLIHLILISDWLMQYHDWIAADIIDDVLEEIRLGMEMNNPKYNQRRTAMVKFLGEMYNYRLIDR